MSGGDGSPPDILLERLAILGRFSHGSSIYEGGFLKFLGFARTPNPGRLDAAKCLAMRLAISCVPGGEGKILKLDSDMALTGGVFCYFCQASNTPDTGDWKGHHVPSTPTSRDPSIEATLKSAQG